MHNIKAVGIKEDSKWIEQLFLDLFEDLNLKIEERAACAAQNTGSGSCSSGVQPHEEWRQIR